MAPGSAEEPGERTPTPSGRSTIPRSPLRPPSAERHPSRRAWFRVKACRPPARMPEQPPAPTEDFRYWAFISYSHSDERWAAWLHHVLETYRVPAPLAGGPTRDGARPRRLFPVFRDRD